jgi:hypothetical protein
MRGAGRVVTPGSWRTLYCGEAPTVCQARPSRLTMSCSISCAPLEASLETTSFLLVAIIYSFRKAVVQSLASAPRSRNDF